MKYAGVYYISNQCGRSREGAWIEITLSRVSLNNIAVAPARERGLKFRVTSTAASVNRRSREGAWIEILKKQTGQNAAMYVAPARERGLK